MRRSTQLNIHTEYCTNNNVDTVRPFNIQLKSFYDFFRLFSVYEKKCTCLSELTSKKNQLELVLAYLK